MKTLIIKLLLVFLGFTLYAKSNVVDSLSNLKKFPVVINNDTLFYIQNRLGSLSAKERAERTQAILMRLEENLMVVPDSIKAEDVGLTTDILYQKEIIFSVADADADSLHIARNQLANNYRSKMAMAIKNYKNQTDFYTLLLRGAQGLLILIVLLTCIVIVNKYSNRVLHWLSKLLSKRLRSIKIKDYELISKAGALILFRRLFHIFKYIFILLLVYATLPFVFRLFPWTKNWSDKLINFVINPLRNILNSVINFIPDLIAIVIIFFVFRYINKLIRFLAQEIETGKLKINGFYPDWAQPSYNIVRFIIYAFMVVVIWPFLPGSDSEIFKGVSVFVGLLVSFGSSTAIGNIVAGLVITYMRPFRIGDRVSIGEVTGDVIEKAFLVTRIKTIKNEIITIPNAAILNGNTTNYSLAAKEEGLVIHTTVTIGYDTPWPKVHQMLIDAALRCDGILKEKQPFVLQTSLDDWYVSYQLNAYTDQPHQMALLYSTLHQEIQNVFFENGVEIMSPHYQTLRDGNEIAMPPHYRSADYSVAGFNIKQKK